MARLEKHALVVVSATPVPPQDKRTLRVLPVGFQ